MAVAAQYGRASLFWSNIDAGEGAIEVVASTKFHVIRVVVALVFLAVATLGCSGDDPAPAGSSDPNIEHSAGTGDAADGDESTRADGADGVDELGEDGDDPGEADDDSAGADSAGDDAAGDDAGPTLASEGHAGITELDVGEQVEDEQGNLIAIYGFMPWPVSFEDMADSTRLAYPFFGDVEDAGDPDAALLVIDIGMCSAGIDANGFGTADFFLHDAADEVLSTDRAHNRGLLARHPVVQPGFRFPAAAACARGFLPVLWSGEEDPRVARYVLANRSSADADIERHIYQWNIEGASIDGPPNGEGDDDAVGVVAGAERFAVGQTVTFNEGRLADTTIEVDGWAERVGVASEIEGTRVVSVSLTVCPAGPVLPELGLAIDGWNIVAPLPGGILEPGGVPIEGCVEGWLDFAAPFGGEPTAFFASDGANAVIGYAEWSLVGAALPVPQ